MVVHLRSAQVGGCTPQKCTGFMLSLMPRPHTPPSKKRSGEWSQISWAYFQNVLRTNQIVRLLHHFSYSSKICLSSWVSPYSLSRCDAQYFRKLVSESTDYFSRNLTWLTRPHFLMRGRGVPGRRLFYTAVCCSAQVYVVAN